jgi:hypothetical protein
MAIRYRQRHRAELRVQRKRYRIEGMLKRTGGSAAAEDAVMPDALRHELAAVVQSHGGRLAYAAAELGAAIEAMEKAAVVVLGAAEGVDERARALAACSPEAKAFADDVRGRMARIYESCSFHDMAGQRIAKVIALLSNLDRLLSGALADEDGAPAARGLINGPRLDGASGHITQVEIDGIFGYPEA